MQKTKSKLGGGDGGGDGVGDRDGRRGVGVGGREERLVD